MNNTANGRLLLVVVLLIGHAMLFPLFAQQPVTPDAGVYADSDEFILTPNQYISEPVVTGGYVQQTTPIIIQAETSQGAYNITLTDTNLSPSTGDKVRTFGTLTAPKTVKSIYSFVVPQRGLWYTWGISFLAGIWVLARLIQHWTVNLSRLSFSRRDTPLTAREVGAMIESMRGDDDA